jgi:uncharacterized repeat protein (TIGR04138 family)
VSAIETNLSLAHPALTGSGYPEAAFRFVLEGLSFTAERASFQHASGGLPMPDLRHVSGQQLCLGLRELAIERFGLLAPCVLRHWKIARTEDFGRIVYALIEAEQLAKSPDDSIDDFHSVFDFEEAFSPSALSQRVGRN